MQNCESISMTQDTAKQDPHECPLFSGVFKKPNKKWVFTVIIDLEYTKKVCLAKSFFTWFPIQFEVKNFHRKIVSIENLFYFFFINLIFNILFSFDNSGVHKVLLDISLYKIKGCVVYLGKIKWNVCYYTKYLQLMFHWNIVIHSLLLHSHWFALFFSWESNYIIIWN